MNGPSSRLWYRDLVTLLRARAIIIGLNCSGLDAAINAARAGLAAEEARRQYLRETLPAYLTYADPGKGETLVLEFANGQHRALPDRSRTLLRQILDLEREQGIQVVKVIHDDGRRQWTYCL